MHALMCTEYTTMYDAHMNMFMTMYGYICVDVWVSVCLHAYVHICGYVNACACVFVCVSVCMDV